jgi:hypothetical protein
MIYPILFFIATANSTNANKYSDTIEISRTITQSEKRGYFRCNKDSAQISVQVKFEISDTLPAYTIDAYYKYDTIFTSDTGTISYEFLRKKPNEMNTMFTGKGNSYCIKDAIITRKDGKFFGFGVYDTFNVMPLTSGKINFDLKGKIIPWGLRKDVKFKQQITTLSDTILTYFSGKNKTTYTIKFLANEHENP